MVTDTLRGTQFNRGSLAAGTEARPFAVRLGPRSALHPQTWISRGRVSRTGCFQSQIFRLKLGNFKSWAKACTPGPSCSSKTLRSLEAGPAPLVPSETPQDKRSINRPTCFRAVGYLLSPRLYPPLTSPARPFPTPTPPSHS